MPILPKLISMRDMDWDQVLKTQKRRLLDSPGKGDAVAGLLGQPTQEALGDDLSEVLSIRGPEEAAKALPTSELRKRLRAISEGDTTQDIGGGIGALGGGLLGAGAGALTMGLSRGAKNAKWGLLAGLPSAIGGYSIGKNAVRDQQILTMLNEELGPGGGIKRAYVEEGFDEILKELKGSKHQGTYNRTELKGAIRDLKQGRGYGLKPTERHLIRRHILGDKKLRFEDSGWREPKMKKPGLLKSPSTPKPNVPRSFKPKVKPNWVGKKPLIIAGGLAALAGLGLTAAKFWPKSDESKSGVNN